MFYPVVFISYLGQRRPIILQTKNGACPLVAICNILFLRGEISLAHDQRLVEFHHLKDKIVAYLRRKVQDLSGENQSESAIANTLQNFEDAMRLVPRLEDGLDVNVMFQNPNQFEFTPEIAVFELYGIRLMHGWVSDPQNHDQQAALDGLSYNQAVTLLTEDVFGNSSSGATVANGDVAQVLSDDELAAKQRRQDLVRDWINQTSNQLTVFGLMELRALLHEGELVVLFRNNHFATLLFRGGNLFLLVTDAIIHQSDNRLVWHRIDDISGDDQYVDANFHIPAGPYIPAESPSSQQQQQQMHPNQQQTLSNDPIIRNQQLAMLHAQNPGQVAYHSAPQPVSNQPSQPGPNNRYGQHQFQAPPGQGYDSRTFGMPRPQQRKEKKCVIQ